MTLFWRILGILLITFTLGFLGFIATLISLMTTRGEFLVIFIPMITLGIILFLILAMYDQLRKIWVKKSIIIYFSACLLSLVAHEGYKLYERSLQVVSTQDVDLHEYQPFTKNNKLVTLENVDYKISENLPKIDGATALYPVYAAFAQAVYPEKDYPLYDSEVVSTQTSGSFERLLNGEVDIIFIAPPSKKQLDAAKRKGVELNMTPIGREAFVFFVHKDNPIDSLTVKQIQQIYSGEITNWQEVGGENVEIRAFQRPEGSGSQSALIHIMNGIPLMKPPSKDVVSGMGGIIEYTSEYQNRKNAIGFSFRFFSQEMVNNGKIKFISVEGVEPTVENIQNGTYPFVDQFYAITASTSNPHVEEFIKWMQSKQGQEIVEKTGYVPVN